MLAAMLYPYYLTNFPLQHTNFIAAMAQSNDSGNDLRIIRVFNYQIYPIIAVSRCQFQFNHSQFLSIVC
jgi:hypothetical protein